MALVSAVAVALSGQGRPSADPVPADRVPTTEALGSVGRLAYGLDGDIYVADGDGRNPVRIADGPSRQGGGCGGYWGEGQMWSPDGRYLAFRGNGEVGSGCDRTVNITDAAGHRTAQFPGDGWQIAWSPDSTRVAVWVDFLKTTGSKAGGPTRLAIHGLDGVRQALLTTPPPGWNRVGDVDPVWSRDGASLLIPGGLEIPVDGSTPRLLAPDDPRSHPTAAYSPNGDEIAYVGLDGLTLAAADGSRRRVMVPRGPRALDLSSSLLEWSPAGDRVAFKLDEVTEASESDPHRFGVLDVASGRVVSLPELGGYGYPGSVSFSLEGDRIVFPRTDAAGVFSLWSVNVDGSQLRRVVVGTAWGDWQTVRPAQ